MSRLAVCLWFSLLLHAVVIGGVGFFAGSSAKSASKPAAASKASMALLMRVGNPVPVAASCAATPEPAPPKPRLLAQLPPAAAPVVNRPENRPTQPEPSREAPAAANHPSVASAGAPAGQSGPAAAEGGSSESNAYLAHIRRKIEEQKKYPGTAWRAREEGQMTFSLKIDGQGRIRNVELLDARASLRLQRAGEAAIRGAGYFDPPPAPWRDGLTVTVPIRFTLSQR